MNEHLGRRLEKIRGSLKDNNLDAIIVLKRENYNYLAGFTGTSAHLLITSDDAILFTDFRYTQQATLQAPFFKVVEFTGNVNNYIYDFVKEKNIVKLGFEDNYLTFSKYNEIKLKLQEAELIPVGMLIEKLRMIKDDYEINVLKKAVDIADAAFTHILDYIKPGVAESDISIELDYFIKKQGGAGCSFDTIVASGKRSSMPHGVASNKKIVLGDAITLDFGALYNYYCSDMTRTVFVGTPDTELKKIYKIVLEAQLTSLAGAKKGLTGKDIDSIARNIITDNGYGKNFGHGLGHGVGLEIHEEPRLSPSGNINMENKMAVTIEPGIYVNDLGGVRIEDMIIINDDAPIVLTKSTKEMLIL